MPNFANSAATVRVTSLEAQAQQVARASDRRRVTDQTLMSQPEVPPAVWQSMEQQGMANQGFFSPGAPLTPNEPLGSEPRQYEYMIGQNIVQRPRSTENIGFDTMRAIIEMYDVAQMAIEVRQDELRNLDWDIVPYDEEDTKYESEIKRIRAFFEKPDGHMLFDDFQNMLAYDWLAFDALSIFPHLTKGGQLGALEPVDGTTITPMIDVYGRSPESPAPAYVQWMYGLPYVWMTRDGLIYRPYRKRTNKLYGFSPIEYMLNVINTDIRYQLYFLQFFTDGTVPDTWIEAPVETNGDPARIQEIQRLYNAVMVGDQSMRHKVRFIPFGAKVTQAKETKFDVNFPQFMLTKACAAWKVTPAELGFTEKVNKSSGESQQDVQYRRSIKPSAQFFARIYTGIIHKYFGLPNLRFKYLNLEEQEDLFVMAQRDKIYASIGVISPDELRTQRLGMEVDPQNPVPRMFITERQALPIQDAIQQSAAAIRQLNAQAAASRAQAGQDPNQPDDVTVNNDDPAVDQQLLEDEEAAEKAAMDFFASPPTTRTHTSKRG